MTINRTLSHDKTSFLRIVGDIHGYHKWYRRLTKGHSPSGLSEPEYTIQIGDLGFMYNVLDELDPQHHKVLAGNHDNYAIMGNYPHFLGDFGVHTIPEFGDVFFIRGAFSIDKVNRSLGVDWWEEEELTVEQGEEALKLYKEVKPDFVISHDAPLNVVPYVTNPRIAFNFGFSNSVIKTKTAQLLQVMAAFHRPKIHFFGHYHVDFDCYVDATNGEVMPDDCLPEDKKYYTRYICVDKMKHIDLDKDFLQNMRE